MPLEDTYDLERVVLFAICDVEKQLRRTLLIFSGKIRHQWRVFRSLRRDSAQIQPLEVGREMIVHLSGLKKS